MKTKPDWYYNQSAVIPFREKGGKLEVLLITSRNKQNWIIPKGIIEIGLRPEISAAKEAEEEAGVEGDVSAELIGSYNYFKWGGKCNVKVYHLRVKNVTANWAEENFRKREWFTVKKAIQKIKKPGLKKILLQFKKNFNGRMF